MIRAVLFDLDDTLIPEAAAIRGALAAACRPLEQRLELPEAVLAQALEAVGKATWQVLDRSGIDARFGVTWEECLWGRIGEESRRLIPSLPAVAAMMRSTVFSDALAACGVRSPLAQELEARFAAERRKRLVPFEESAGLVHALRRRGLKVGCATNGASEVQREKLAASGTARWFDAITVSGEEGVGKPDPTILVRLCERLSVGVDEAVYVGNSTARDVAAARAAGMRSVLCERFEPEEPPHGAPNVAAIPDRMVYEVDGILGWIDGWRAGRAFRIVDGAGAPVAVDEPLREDGRYVTRVGAEGDELRPAVRAATPLAALEAAVRGLRARFEGRGSHELGEPIEWDALLR
ncbi:MAG TPA: HAD family hydrolase [Vulgatibacter sp.]